MPDRQKSSVRSDSSSKTNSPSQKNKSAASTEEKAPSTKPQPSKTSASTLKAKQIPNALGGKASSTGRKPSPSRGNEDRLAELQQLFIHELKDVYSAENQILKALPKMIKAAANDELSSALEEHRQVTKKQVERLDTVLAALNEKSGGKKCKGMEGLLEEGEDLLEEDASAEVIDAGIIAATQKVEHYEIAAYGTLVAFARRLGHDDAVLLLEQTLAEEKEADERLSEIAESSVNELAA